MCEENKQDEKVELLLNIARQAEWSKLVYMGENIPSIYCCSLCGGVKSSEIEQYAVLKEDVRFHCGHSPWCLYNKIIR